MLQLELAGSLGLGLSTALRLRPLPLRARGPQVHPLPLFLEPFPSLGLSSLALPSLAAATTGRAAAPFITSSPSHLPATSILQTMEGADFKESEAESVIKVAREPAIIINGVPDLPPDCTAGALPEVKNDAKSQVDPHFGEWLEGRKVRKLFGDTYYVGKVVKYDSEGNWYNIIYDDGDQEDLEWCELEEVLLPLDITVPLRTLVIDKCKLQGSIPDYSRPKVGRPKKLYATIGGDTKGTSNMVTVSHGNDVTNNQMVMFGVEGQASNQSRKRGRPRKDGSLSANSQPKKRGRPPKNRNSLGNSQSAENTPDSLALEPVQDNAHESSRSQNSTLQHNTMTVRAEKLKRENLRVQGTPSGTQKF